VVRVTFDTIDLSSDDVALQHVIREFASTELAVRASELDSEGRFPDEAVTGMARLGLFGLAIPKEFGGLSATRVQTSIVIEEIARACGSSALTLMAHLHSSGFIARYGTHEQKRQFLAAAASGERIAAIAMTEPEAGTDLAAMRATARGHDGHYVINARKTFITNGDRAGVFVVFAKIAGWAGAGDGITAFIVQADTPGVSAGKPLKKMGLRASSTTEVRLEDVSVALDDRVGEEGEGLSLALRSLDGARLSTAAQALGLAQGAFDIVLRYACVRVQSGTVIARHQAVQLRLADMQVALSASRALLYQVARAVDEGRTDTAAPAAAAKVFCTSNASRITSQAVELLGGYGFMEECELSRYMRDAKGGEIYDGTNDVNRLLIARHLVKGIEASTTTAQRPMTEAPC
jgi:alkylation response protein AidB-like acyl-CoA dehydrogenase